MEHDGANENAVQKLEGQAEPIKAKGTRLIIAVQVVDVMLVLEGSPSWSNWVDPDFSEAKCKSGTRCVKERHLSNYLKRKIHKTIDDQRLFDDVDHFPAAVLLVLLRKLLLKALSLAFSLNLLEFHLLLIELLLKLQQLSIGLFTAFGLQLVDKTFQMCYLRAELVFGFVLVNRSLVENCGRIFEPWEEDQHVAERQKGLSHDCHEQNSENCDDMESQIDENGALLDHPEVRRVVLDLPLLLLHEVPGPNVDVLEIDVCSQEVVKVILASPVVLLGELVLLIGELDLPWR